MEQNCSMCLKKDKKNYFHIFSQKFENGLCIYEIFKLFTSIILKNQDEQTKSKICYECHQKLLLFYNDRQNAITNNDIIRRWIDQDTTLAGSQEIAKLEINNTGFDDPLIIIDCSGLVDVKIEEEVLDDLEDSHHNISEAENQPLADSKPEHNLKKFRRKKDANVENSKTIRAEFKIIKPSTLKYSRSREIEFETRKQIRSNCKVCGISVRKDVLKRHHERVHLKIKKHVCRICSKGFFVKSDLLNHMPRHEGDPTVPCIIEDCSTKFFSNNDRRVHVNTVHGSKENVLDDLKDSQKNPKHKRGFCPVCGISVREDLIKRHHERVHLKIKKFFCDICNRGFYVKACLMNHIPRHYGEPTVPCLKEDCKIMFFSLDDRRVHINAVHVERLSNHLCTYPMCSLAYDTVGKLNNHIKNFHLRVRKHICPNCQEGFFAPKDLREHMTKYLENYITCDECGEKFNSLRKLKLHFFKLHLPPPYACSTCGKTFKIYQKYLLKLHELSHQDKKDHPCEVCSKPFKTRVNTLEHIRAVHFKSKIKCELCGRSFPRPGYYKVHVKTKHEDLGAEKIEEWLARITGMRPDYDKLEWVFT